MLKTIGIALVVLGAGSFGFRKGFLFYKQLRQLRALSAAMEILKCELNYTLLPLSRLCALTAQRSEGAIAAFFYNFRTELDKGLPRARAASDAVEATPGLLLPPDALMALLELCGGLGRYDMDGENRLLQLTQHRIAACIERCETERRPLAKSYAILGLCAGVAIVILLV